MTFKTKNLKIIPLTAKELETLINEGFEKLEQALGLSPSGTLYDENSISFCKERLGKTLGNEKNKKYLWSTLWLIVLKAENKTIGSLSFVNEPDKDKKAELQYSIDEAYRNNGYISEIFDAIENWVFGFDEVDYLQIKTEKDNTDEQKLAEEKKYQKVSENESFIFWQKEKPKTSWLPIFMCLGVSLGICFGSMFDNISIGMCLGICIGLLIGAVIDASNKKSSSKEDDNKDDNNKKE